ncbi:redoxin family protein [Nocardia sp. NPDC056064]|uniref:redoxin family protein n=1 Tax=Nocardia sp. NPDC056064 TaxID=3345701 RepID=UPI0035DDA273
MKIGQLARQTDLSPKAIRRYEALGLVTPTRLPNGYREYDEGAVRLVREIRMLNRLGIPVAETRAFLDCLTSGSAHGDDCPSALAEYQRAIDELTTRIDVLTERRDGLVRRLSDAAYRNSSAAPASAMPPLRVPAPSAEAGPATRLLGLPTPALTFPATDGSEIDLAALGDGRTVVYLYPLTGRPDTDLPTGWTSIPGARGCTAQACGFRDHHAELLAAGAHGVFGLSSQDCDYQREVVERLGLPFAMLADPELLLAGALGLPTFEVDGMRLYTRSTLVIRNGVIEHVFAPVREPAEHAGEVVRWLARG